MLCNSPQIKTNLRLGAFGTSLHPTETPKQALLTLSVILLTFQCRIIEFFVVEFKALTHSLFVGQVCWEFLDKRWCRKAELACHYLGIKVCLLEAPK